MSGLVAVACATVFMTPAPAGATQDPEATRAEAGRHCVATPGDQKPTCYDTFRESVAAATGGRITDAPVTPQKAALDRKFLDKMNAPARKAGSRTVTGSSNTMAGVLYEHGGSRAGRTLILNTHYTCGSGTELGYLNLGSSFYQFNDITSAVLTGSGCKVELFEHIHFEGARQTYSGSVDLVGSAMNDRASSLLIS
ncbi:hypothetical protein [Streptomyces sp. NPDC026589]|uniref:hypothetical protein n=1 Tax=Streptomyces sp. NPDC026589 TaxID=3155609 RepID=UPI0033DD14B2